MIRPALRHVTKLGRAALLATLLVGLLNAIAAAGELHPWFAFMLTFALMPAWVVATIHGPLRYR